MRGFHRGRNSAPDRVLASASFLIAVLLTLAIGEVRASPPDPPDAGEDRWWNGFFAPGLAPERSSVGVLETVHGEVVVGGDFTTIGGAAIPHAARFDGAAWRSCGGGPGDVITAGALDGDGVLCVVGAGDAPWIRRWDGVAWSTVAPAPLRGIGRRKILAVTRFEGRVVIGGLFDEVGGTAAQNVAAWDGTRWVALGDGVTIPQAPASDCVTSLAVHAGRLVVAGWFSHSGPDETPNVATWDGTRWRALGGGIDGFVNGLAVHRSDLYAVGTLSSAGNSFARTVARWNGSHWKGIEASLPRDFRMWSLSSVGDELLAMGRIQTDSDFGIIVGPEGFYTALASWDGRTWTLQTPEFHNGSPARFTQFEGQLVAAGWFESVGDAAVNGLAMRRDGTWRGIASGFGLAAPDDDAGFPAKARVFVEFQGDLIVGGRFDFAGDHRVRGVARWTGAEWQPMGTGVEGQVQALAVWGDRLVAGGTFREAGGVAAHNVAVWDGTSWSALGAGFEGSVCALAVHENRLVAGGSFNKSGAAWRFNVARWNGSTWESMRDGLFYTVHALAVYRGELLAGGNFQWDGQRAVRAVARWTGDAWEELGGGVEGGVMHLRVANERLYAVGGFSRAGTAVTHGIASWDGSTWSAIGDRADLFFRDAAWYNGELVASASYYAPRPAVRGRLYRFDGSNWTPLSRESNANFDVLVPFEGGLYCGGAFQRIGDKSSRGIARWDGLVPVDFGTEAPQPWAVLESLRVPRPGSSVQVSYRLGVEGVPVSLGIYDVRGRLVRSLVREVGRSGRFTATWDRLDESGASVARGIYLVRLEAAPVSATRKLALVHR